MIRQTVNLSHSKKKKILVLLTSASIFISMLLGYFCFFVDSVQEGYGPDEHARFLYDTQVFWLVTIVVIVYLFLEIGITISWLKRNSKVESLICVIALLHFIAQIYFLVRYYYGSLFCVSFLLVTLIIDAFLLWTFLPRKLKNEV